MKGKAMILMLLMMAVAGMSFASDDPAALETPASSPSIGAQAGEAARELKGTADQTLSAGAEKVAETSAKVQTEAQETMKTLQEQWDVLAKQLQEKTRQLQQQMDQQWQDFQKSFNKPKE